VTSTGGRTVLVTGATGIISWSLTHALSETTDRVRVLARNPIATAEVVPGNVTVVAGDLTDPKSVDRAMHVRPRPGVLVDHPAGPSPTRLRRRTPSTRHRRMRAIALSIEGLAGHILGTLGVHRGQFW
jgi:nucleoside-diphosphate-sugar epimerase